MSALQSCAATGTLAHRKAQHATSFSRLRLERAHEAEMVAVAFGREAIHGANLSESEVISAIEKPSKDGAAGSILTPGGWFDPSIAHASSARLRGVDMSWSEDPTQGREAGEEPYEDPSQGGEIGERPGEDPAGSGATAPGEDPMQGGEVGEEPYEDPSQGGEVGELPGEDPTERGG